MRWSNLVLVVVVLSVFSMVSVLAAGNITQQQSAQSCLQESQKYIDEVAQLNISVIRFNDTYGRAKSLYDAQIIISQRNGKTDFSQILSYCDQIKTLKEEAINAYDIFGVFLNFYNTTVDRNAMNTSSIDSIIDQIYAELKGERYENVANLIDQGYTEITKVKSEQTTLVLAYKSTTRGIKEFLNENKIGIAILLVVVIILYMLYRTKISEWMVKRRLDSLMLRRDTLKKLIGDTQRAYFQTGKLPESDYRIRTKNFADLIRDIDRQIPLLQKELAAFSSASELKRIEQRDKKKLKR